LSLDSRRTTGPTRAIERGGGSGGGGGGSCTAARVKASARWIMAGNYTVAGNTRRARTHTHARDYGEVARNDKLMLWRIVFSADYREVERRSRKWQQVVEATALRATESPFRSFVIF